MKSPFAIELFAGTGSGTAGHVELGGTAVCFDLEYLPHHGPAAPRSHRVIQDVLTIHGSQFKDALWLWGSPPCQKYSYLAMPWSRSKCPLCKGRKEYYAWQLTLDRPPASSDVATWGEPIVCDCKENSRKAKELRADWEKNGPDNRLFDACFRIQREAIEATITPEGKRLAERCLLEISQREELLRSGSIPKEMEGILQGLQDWSAELRIIRKQFTRYIPLLVENVRGAIPWVGSSKAQFGSFHIWGDVAQIGKRVIAGRDLADIRAGRGRFGMGVAPEGRLPPKRAMDDLKYGVRKMLHEHLPVGSGPLGRNAPGEGVKTRAHVNKRDGHGHTRHLTNQAESDAVRAEATKIGGDWFSDPNSTCRKHGSKSNARKAASALIARIPESLSRYVAEMHWPG